MKLGKATGRDSISVEHIKSLENYIIDKITKLLNKIYNTCQVRSKTFPNYTLPKKPRATECELHRTISLTNHVTKILLRILMMQVTNKMKAEIAEEQCGFVARKGTTNVIYTFRTILEGALEVQKEV